MDTIWIIVFFIGLLNLQPTNGQSEFDVQLVMQKYVERNGSVIMQCKHNVRPDILFKVTWLKVDRGKFFEFIKGRNPPFRNNSVEGAEIDFENSNEGQVTLKNVGFSAAGYYFCEVSTDTPIFTKASAEEYLHIFIPQTGPPTIRFRKKEPFMIGERLLAMCNTTRSRPAPHITWLINGKKIENKYIRTHHINQMPPPKKDTSQGPKKVMKKQVQHQYPLQYHLPGDRYDKSLRSASGSSHWGEDWLAFIHHQVATRQPNVKKHNNPFGSLTSMHEVSHKSFDNNYEYVKPRKHRKSTKHKNRRSSGVNLSTLRSQTGLTGSAAGSMASIYNALADEDNALLSTQISPSIAPNPQGVFSLSQLNVEISEKHIDSMGRLELTCLATIPSSVDLGEQYSDYKTYSVHVEIGKPIKTPAATTPTPSIGMAALGNGSFASSIHTWPVKILISCLFLLRIQILISRSF